jgi:tetratricopeptide (TPR) repeat protein
MFGTKIDQLRLERNYVEAVRLLRARLTQEDDASYHVAIAFMQRFAGDTAGAKVAAEKARNLLESLCRDRPDDWGLAELMSEAYAALGEKDLALKAAERAIMLLPTAKDAVNGPIMEENLALIQTIVGENSSAISNLTRLLQTSYGLPRVTPALLRLDPSWDSLRADPRFQKLCQEKTQ